MGVTLKDEEVQAVHGVLDSLSSSMDWGSGFLDDEAVAQWNIAAQATGYPAVAQKKVEPGIYRSQTYEVVALDKCASYQDTSVLGSDGEMTPVRAECRLRKGHRGSHQSSEATVRIWT